MRRRSLLAGAALAPVGLALPALAQPGIVLEGPAKGEAFRPVPGIARQRRVPGERAEPHLGARGVVHLEPVALRRGEAQALLRQGRGGCHKQREAREARESGHDGGHTHAGVLPAPG